jgi:hypothetical protein
VEKVEKLDNGGTKVSRTDGTIEYFDHRGRHHNDTGDPAIVRSNGDLEYWINGRRK